METIILVLLMGGMNLLAFLIGARTAQKAEKGEEIKMPTINPMKIYEQYEEERIIKDAERERDIMLENINNYTGDSTGQKDIK